MDYTEYLIIAAQHSKYNAAHWFRYLRKIIDKNSIDLTQEQINYLYNCDELTPFQRVSLKTAFKNDTITQKHLIRLNQRIVPSKLALMRAKYGN